MPPNPSSLTRLTRRRFVQLGGAALTAYPLSKFGALTGFAQAADRQSHLRCRGGVNAKFLYFA